jgi:uncharacterized protein YyaL (SSP411 family)
VQLALTGDPASPDFHALARTASDVFVPSLILAGGDAGTTGIALLADRPMRDGKATAYVCRGYSCDAPTTDARELWEQLSRARRSASAP